MRLADEAQIQWWLRTGTEVEAIPGWIFIPVGGDDHRSGLVRIWTDKQDQVRCDRRNAAPHVLKVVDYTDDHGQVINRAYVVEVCGQRQTIYSDDLSKGDPWGKFRGLTGTTDPKMRQVLTAVVQQQARELDPEYGRPFFDSAGYLIMPPDDVLPEGYCNGLDSDRAALAELTATLSRYPLPALLLALSAVAPFVGPLGLQAGTLHLSGDTTIAKTTTLTAVAALWGRAYRGVVSTWGGTVLGVQGAFRDLQVLPVFRDEMITAGLGGRDRAYLFSQIMEGCRRTARTRADIARPSPRWSSVCFSTGNMRAVPAQHVNEGTAKGVWEIPVDRDLPLIPPEAKEYVQQITNVPAVAGSWVPVVRRIPVSRVQELHEQAGTYLLRPADTTVGWHRWRLLCLALAGAWLLGETTGVDLATPVHAAAVELLERTEQERRDDDPSPAERLWETLWAFTMSRPAAFAESADSHMDRLGWLEQSSSSTQCHVFSHKLGEIVKAAELDDRQVALAVLRSDGRLITTGSAGLRHEVKRDGVKIRVYTFSRTYDFSPGTAGDPGDRAGQGPNFGPRPADQAGTAGDRPGTGEETAGHLTSCDRVPAACEAEAGHPPTGTDSPEADKYAGQSGPRPVPAPGTAVPGPRRVPGDRGLLETSRPCVACGQPSSACYGELPLHVFCALPEQPAAPADPLATVVLRRHPDQALDWSVLATARGLLDQVTRGLRLDTPSISGQLWYHRTLAQYGSVPELDKLPEPVELDARVRASVSHVNMSVPVPAGAVVLGPDVNAQYLAAAGSVSLGTGLPELIQPTPDQHQAALKLPGYLEFATPVPLPFGASIDAGDLVPTPLALLAWQYGRGELPPIVRWLAWPQHRRWLAQWAKEVRRARAELLPAASQGSSAAVYALDYLKELYAAFLGGMLRSTRHNRTATYRPDWSDQVVALAQANMLRGIGKAKVPVLGWMKDTAWFVCQPGTVQVAGLEYREDRGELYRQPGKWKPERACPVTPAIQRAASEGRPGKLRDAVNAADRARRQRGAA